VLEVVRLAVRQLEAYNAWDLDAFVACYHPQVQVFSDGVLTMEGQTAFREAYRAKFEGGDFGGRVPRRIEAGERCIEEEHYWTKSGARGSILVEYALREGAIGTVRFTRFEGLVSAVSEALSAGDALAVPGLGRFGPSSDSGPGSVRFQRGADAPGGPHERVARAIVHWMAQQDALDILGFGRFEQSPAGLAFHADEALVKLVERGER